MRRKIFVVVIISAIVLLGVYRMYQSVVKSKISRQKHLEQQKFVYVVKTVPVKYQRIYESMDFVGEVKGINEVSVLPKVVGRLSKKIVEEGSFVKKDEVICEVDRDEPVLKYSMYEVKSPIDGILVKYFVDIGGMVSPQTPLCIVADTSKIRVVFSVPENLSYKITQGTYIKFSIGEMGRKFFSSNLQVSNYIDPVSRTMEVKCILDNENNTFKSGSFVKGEIVFREKNVLSIPEDAVVVSGDEKYVFVVKDNNVVEKRKISTGTNYKGTLEILSGLKVEEKVVYQGMELLSDGDTVKVVEEK